MKKLKETIVCPQCKTTIYIPVIGLLRVKELEDEFDFDVNGERIAAHKVKRTFVADDELPAVWYEVDLVDCPPFAGDNELGMLMTRLSDHHKGDKVPYMEELEVIVEIGDVFLLHEKIGL